MRRWHVCGADYTGIHRLRHEPAARLNFEPPGPGFDEYFVIASSRTASRVTGMPVTMAGMAPDMLLNRGIKRPTVTFHPGKL
jgi:hypothetical protein